jgi:hypothetical protein
VFVSPLKISLNSDLIPKFGKIETGFSSSVVETPKKQDEPKARG